MGGNAIKTVPMRRLTAAEYHPFAEAVSQSLRQRFGTRAQALPAYRQKPDFGDLDVVVEQEKVRTPGDNFEALRAFAEEFGGSRVFLSHRNNPTVTYDHWVSPGDSAAFQVDVIMAPAAEFDATVAYFSYNDLGNLIGRTAHKMGFSYGHRGLLLPIRDGTHLVATVPVSADLETVLPFLGYDPRRFRQGFDTMTDIFDYVTGSKRFDPALFLLESRNHTDRMRDRKRPTYRSFLEHLQTRGDWPTFVFPKDKSVWLSEAFAHFPDFQQRYEQALAEHAVAKETRVHFNGELVAEWTGLTGKDLGAFMAQARTRLEAHGGVAQVLRDQGPDALKALVLATPRRLGLSP